VALNRRFSASTYPFLVIVERMVAYVLGRPMPSFSRVFTSDASLYRGGGWVECWLSFRPSFSRGCPAGRGGRGTASGRPAGQTLRYPSNFSIWPLALNTPWSAWISTFVTATMAGVIWLATNRL